MKQLELKPIKEQDKIYWAEDTILGWKVLSGYYLGSYPTYFGTMHIATMGSIGSCVVRHLDVFYSTKREAWASIADEEAEK